MNAFSQPDVLRNIYKRGLDYSRFNARNTSIRIRAIKLCHFDLLHAYLSLPFEVTTANGWYNWTTFIEKVKEGVVFVHGIQVKLKEKANAT